MKAKRVFISRKLRSWNKHTLDGPSQYQARGANIAPLFLFNSIFFVILQVNKITTLRDDHLGDAFLPQTGSHRFALIGLAMDQK